MRRRLVSLSVVALALLAGCDRTDRQFGTDGVSRFGFAPTDAVARAGSTGFIATGVVPSSLRTAVASMGPDGKTRWQVTLPSRFEAVAPTATFAGDAVNVVGTTDGRIEIARVRAGALDESYGDDGIATSEIEIDEGRASAMTDSQGRTVVIGQRGDAMVYARFRSSGAPEREVEITLARNVPIFGDAVLTSDDRILVTYARFDGKISDLVVTRLMPDGKLDPSFGGNGIVTIAAGQDIVPSSMVVRPDGRIVVAGLTHNDLGVEQALLAGLTAEGDPDPAFGVYGLSIVDEDGGRAPRLTLGGPGLLLAMRSGNGDVATHAFTAEGAPVDAWGDGGRQVNDLGGPANVTDVVQLAGRSIVLVKTFEAPGGALLALK